MEEKKTSSNKLEEKKTSPNKLIIGILIALLLASLGYTWYNNNEHKENENILQEEKIVIQQDLDELISKYDVAIAENTTISEELILERDKIVLFRDSVKNLKNVNYSLIRKYRRQIKSLEDKNQKLLYLTDSLKTTNQFLVQEIDSVKLKIEKQIAVNDTLLIKNLELTEKVAIGSTLKINSVKAITMKERSSGKLVETTRSSRTDAFRVSFRITENELAELGDKKVHIQIKNSEGNTVGQKGTTILKNGGEVGYSDEAIVEYSNQDIDVISLIEVERNEILNGDHYISVFLDGEFVGSTKVSVK